MLRMNGQTCDGGNRTLRWSQFCDGIVDCNDRSDEEGSFCKLCVNNLYSCASRDDIRCDLACKMLRYVPCQAIQDRRACNNLPEYSDDNFLFQLFEEFKLHILTAVIVVLVSIAMVIVLKYLCWPTKVKPSMKSFDLSDESDDRTEFDTQSSHIYEQCYEPPPYETAQRYPLVKPYYEHAV